MIHSWKDKAFLKLGVEGFEPPNGGTKNRCLTTWRHPNTIRESQFKEAILPDALNFLQAYTEFRMKIVHLATEFAPFAKAGGLGEVLVGLSRELARLSHRVEVVLPKYSFIPPIGLHPSLSFLCEEGGHFHENRAWQGYFGQCHLTLLEAFHPKGYFQRPHIYGYQDDTSRFLYFTKAALEWLKTAKESIDVLHLHDWPVAVAAYLQKESYRLPIKKVILTIHNGEYQGLCAHWDLEAIGLQSGTYPKEAFQDEIHTETLNLLKGGVVYADAVNTVSPSYAAEIIAQKGKGIAFARYQHKISGILNGIDSVLWNPSDDPHLSIHYQQGSIEEIERGKEGARHLLAKHFGLSEEKRPWIGNITRLVPQKGPELIEAGLCKTLELGGTFLLLGSSPIASIQNHFETLKKELFTESAFFHFDYNEPLAHQIYAALDFILVPSHFEPCGLTQLIAMRYGTIPIVRKTGGLQDTVFDIENNKKGNGIVFEKATQEETTRAIERAFLLFQTQREKRRELIQRGMRIDFSWKKPAQEYLKIYG